MTVIIMIMIIPSSLRNDSNSDINIDFWFSNSFVSLDDDDDDDDDDDNEISICSKSFVS